MNFVKNFIESQNITSIDKLEEVLCNEQYKLKLKKFKNNELMIIVHQENTNLNEELCNHCHGVIIDPEMNIIRYTSKKAFENEENIKKINETIDQQNAIITPIIDGTFISIFKYKGKVYYSTKKALVVTRFDIDMSECCYCNLCTYPCPEECIFMTGGPNESRHSIDYEFSEPERTDLIYHFSKHFFLICQKLLFLIHF